MAQHDLFDFRGEPPTLLTIEETAELFTDALDIHRASFFRSYRPFLPFIYTRIVPVRGQKGQFTYGSPRLDEAVAVQLCNVAARGYWAMYASGAMRETHPHLYAPPGTREAKVAA